MIGEIVSLPSWERGLKSISAAFASRFEPVAPLVGAWIEIYKLITSPTQYPVAPLVGAWIEIYYFLN